MSLAYERMISLPILEKDTVDSEATCSWDSSIHSLSALNRATNNGERIYAIIRVVVRLSQPVAVDLILRKRICINVYKKPSFTGRLMKNIVGGESLFGTGVYYDLVGHIPKATLNMEDRETLAMMAARHTSEDVFDEKRQRPSPSSSKSQSSYIEAYTKSIQAVEWMLKLDRLRQESAMFITLD
uniref:Kinesin-like domain-containing protein n=1 Tax=Panagrolaimus sp. ES5 TaxID=591445 RepID=A0AC34FNI2_9BILA